jgi:hypothetical protein
MIFALLAWALLGPIDRTLRLCYARLVDLGERYQQLSMLGRDTFLEAVAQAALVLHIRKSRMARGTLGHESASNAMTAAELSRIRTQPPDVLSEETGAQPVPLLTGQYGIQPRKPHILPLAKKLGTPFVDLITLGRTSSNDITLDDLSVSRFQAFFRHRFGRWYLCDAGSRNGTRIRGTLLKARTEVEVKSGEILHFGTLEATFHTADSLYDLLASRK